MENLIAIEGVGEVVAESIFQYFRDKENLHQVEKILEHIKIAKVKIEKIESALSSKIFVVTGTLEKFSREEAKDEIRKRGSKSIVVFHANPRRSRVCLLLRIAAGVSV